MDRRHDEVELRQAVVREVHRSVRPDIALDACEYRDSVQTVVQFPNRASVFERAGFVEAVRHRQ
jgi:hypothetical protein